MAYRKSKQMFQLTRVYQSWINNTDKRIPTKTQTVYIVAHTAPHARILLGEKLKSTQWNTSHTLLWVNEKNNMEKFPIGTMIINNPGM